MKNEIEEKPDVDLAELKLRAIGLSPLILNNSQSRFEIDPKNQYEKARYKIDEQTDGIPASMFKNAIVSMAHTIIKDISKTVVNRSLWIVAEFEGWLLRIEDCVFPPNIYSETLPIGNKKTMERYTRYRPRYDRWTVPFTVEYVKDIFEPASIIDLFNYAGIGSGIHYHRHGRNGEYNRFKVIKESEYLHYKKTKWNRI